MARARSTPATRATSRCSNARWSGSPEPTATTLLVCLEFGQRALRLPGSRTRPRVMDYIQFAHDTFKRLDPTRFFIASDGADVFPRTSSPRPRSSVRSPPSANSPSTVHRRGRLLPPRAVRRRHGRSRQSGGRLRRSRPRPRAVRLLAPRRSRRRRCRRRSGSNHPGRHEAASAPPTSPSPASPETASPPEPATLRQPH